MAEITSDLINLQDVAYRYPDADNMPGIADEPLTVDFGVLVYSSYGGVYSNLADSTLTNYGYIMGGSNTTAVEFDGGHGSIYNGPDGTIRALFGIQVDGANGELITNDGTIIGLAEGVAFPLDSQGVSLTNTGYIYGAEAGVFAGSHFDDAVITNSGRIVGAGFGILVGTGANLVTTIANQVGGRISGPTAAISVAHQCQIHLTNRGTIAGAIDCSTSDNGHDYIRNAGVITGAVVFGGSGRNTFIGTGGTSGPVFGGDGNDLLIGGKAGDRLGGGYGNDVLTGGPGQDRFLFSTVPNSTTNVDTITDFTPGAEIQLHLVSRDKIELSREVFPELNAPGLLDAGMFQEGPRAMDGDDRIIYNPTNGWLSYDSNGARLGGAVHFATLPTGLTLHFTDFLVLL